MLNLCSVLEHIASGFSVHCSCITDGIRHEIEVSKVVVLNLSGGERGALVDRMIGSSNDAWKEREQTNSTVESVEYSSSLHCLILSSAACCEVYAVCVCFVCFLPVAPSAPPPSQNSVSLIACALIIDTPGADTTSVHDSPPSVVK